MNVRKRDTGNGKIINVINLMVWTLVSGDETKKTYYATMWLAAKKIKNGLNKNTLEPHRAYYINKIKRFLDNPEAYEVQQTPVLPDGSPIGTDAFCSQFTL